MYKLYFNNSTIVKDILKVEGEVGLEPTYHGADPRALIDLESTAFAVKQLPHDYCSYSSKCRLIAFQAYSTTASSEFIPSRAASSYMDLSVLVSPVTTSIT